MFSSSLSERKSKSGVRVVENDVLRSQDETLIHTFKNKVSVRIGNEAVDGFLSFTSERLLFSREDDNEEEDEKYQKAQETFQSLVQELHQLQQDAT